MPDTGPVHRFRIACPDLDRGGVAPVAGSTARGPHPSWSRHGGHPGRPPDTRPQPPPPWSRSRSRRACGHRPRTRHRRSAGPGGAGRPGAARRQLLHRPGRRLHGDGPLLRAAQKAPGRAIRLDQGRLPAPHRQEPGGGPRGRCARRPARRITGRRLHGGSLVRDRRAGRSVRYAALRAVRGAATAVLPRLLLRGGPRPGGRRRVDRARLRAARDLRTGGSLRRPPSSSACACCRSSASGCWSAGGAPGRSGSGAWRTSGSGVPRR